MRVEDLTFYHGTGRGAALSIVESRSRESLFDEIGARGLGREIRRALLARAELSDDEDWKLHFAFAGPGMDHSTLWVSALRQLEHPEEISHFDYGHFFATLNIGNAYRYAIGNPYRSEFVLALAESLKVLEALGDPLPQRIRVDYPLVARAIEAPSAPVVIEVRGVSRDRLVGEKGGADITADLRSFGLMKKYDGVSVPAAFRIRDVSAEDIVAVHDLAAWSADEVHDGSWQPDPRKVAAVRIPVREWLLKARSESR